MPGAVACRSGLGATGWRLTASDKMQARKEARELYAAAAEGFDAVALAHAGTPWEVLARRSRAALPGLRWEPDPPAKSDK